MAAIGRCALCQTPGVELLESHVLPKWAYRRIVAYVAGARNPVEVGSGIAVRTSRQVKVNLLCAQCEDRFGRRENYASTIVVQADGAFPALDLANPQRVTQDIVVATMGHLDIDQLTYFAISVFWRADVAQIDPIVHLGPAREAIRRYLLELDPLPQPVELVVQLIEREPTTPRIDRIVIFPASHPESDPPLHDFVICGIWFRLYVGELNGPEHFAGSFPRNRGARIIGAQTVLRQSDIADEVQTSTARGALGRDQSKR